MPPTYRTARTVAELTERFAGRPFTPQDARRAGISPGQLRAAVAAGRLVRLRHGVLVGATALAGCSPDERHVLEARGLLRLVAPAARRPSAAGSPPPMPGCASPMSDRERRVAPALVASHASAAAVLGLPQPCLDPGARWPVEVTRTCGGQAGPRWTCHVAPLPDGHVTVVDDVPTTTLLRTAVDLLRSRPLPDALIVSDAVLRAGISAVTQTSGPAARGVVRDPALVSAGRNLLAGVLAELGPQPGAPAARLGITWTDPAAQNALESASRGHLLVAGVPAPEANAPVVGEDGRTYWVDLCWPLWRVIGEADGRVKYTDAAVLYAEKRRQEALERAGWVVVRWTWEELVRDPAAVVARVQRALRRAGWNGGRG